MLIGISGVKMFVMFVSCFPFCSLSQQHVTWSGPAVNEVPQQLLGSERASPASAVAVNSKWLRLVLVLSCGALTQRE